MCVVVRKGALAVKMHRETPHHNKEEDEEQETKKQDKRNGMCI
jgi:hypothetical protein